MNDFVNLMHYVQLPTDKVAAILGWNVRDVKTPGEFDEIYLLDKDGIEHTVIEVKGEDRGIVISTDPGRCTSRGAKQIERLFGGEALSGHQRDRIEKTLETLGLLTARTVLVEAKTGEDVWGWAATTQTEIRIERADGKVVNTLDLSDTRFIRGDVVALTAKTYNTISDAVWNDTNAYDDAFTDIIQVMPGMLGYILQAKAIGNVPLWGVIDGPLATSQSVCFEGDQPYHVAPEGFIGQFCVPGRAAVWNFIAAERNGVVTIERHAL